MAIIIIIMALCLPCLGCHFLHSFNVEILIMQHAMTKSVDQPCLVAYF